MAQKEKLGEKKETANNEKETGLAKFLNWFKKYSNIIYGVVIGILVIVVAVIAFNRFYLIPKSEKAALQMTKPLEYIALGDSTSLNLALEGDDEYEGLLNIISSYKFTATANTAKFLAGICYYNLKDYDEALNYLKKFKCKEDIMWFECQAVIGDCYDEMDDSANALKYYLKAVKKDKDPFFTPNTLFKIGQMYERTQDWTNAVKYYQMIEQDFYDQYKFMGVDKYLERAQINAAK